MRSIKMTLILCGLMLLVTPTKAHAWWELLDYLSGPGPFFGPRVDVRKCLGGTDISDFQKIDDQLGQLVDNFHLRNARPHESVAETALRLPSLSTAIETLNSLLTRLKAIDSVFPVNTDKLATLESNIRLLENRKDATLQPEDVALLVSAIHEIELALDRIKKASVFSGATSVMVSFCSPNTIRRWAIEGAFASMRSVPTEEWANNHTIWLNQLSAGLSYRFFGSSVTHDVLDAGAMYGGYFLSSAGINGTVSTQVLEPFVDLHAPTSYMDRSGPKYWLSLVTARVTFPIFFRQIAASELNGVGQSDIEKHEKTRFTVTFYYNLWPQLRSRTHKL